MCVTCLSSHSMRAALIWTLLLLLGGVECTPQSTDGVMNADPLKAQDTGDLFLTTLIEGNKTDDARRKSRVWLFQNFSVEAYSGFITINETTNSNLFFLFVVGKDNSTNSPLLLWTQGGPGLSSLFGQFLQNGPVEFDYTQTETFMLKERVNTLQNNMSIIYLDLPVGAGFSFANTEAYPTTLEEISDSVMKFLEQFLKLFPQYVCRDLYVAGESYGARYSMAIAQAFLKKTYANVVQLIFKGTIAGNGFLGPILETADSTEFLYWTSVLDERGRQEFSQKFQYMRELMAAKDNITIPYLLFNTIFADPTEKNITLFQNLTSFTDHASPIHPVRPYNMLACFRFLNETPLVRQQLHVSLNRTFTYLNLPLLKSLSFDFLRNISDITEYVLNESYALFYTGQMDALFPSVNQRKYYERLNWVYSEDYRKAPRHPWRPPRWDSTKGFAAYIRRVKRFSEAVILGMSHYGAAEKPDEVYYLMMEFINNTSHNISLILGDSAPAAKPKT